MVTLTVEEFGKHKGDTVKRFTWRAESGFELTAISYGAIVQSIKVPDKNGIVQDVVLGFDDLASYVSRNIAYFGAAVGRCANRIGGATFNIDEHKYDLAKNVGADALHGGIVGFDKVNWHTTIENTKVIFSYLSKDGEEGYPGDLVTSISYDVTGDGTFLMEFTAATTKRTVVNLTNHSYFNLAGHDGGAEELYKHVVVINADRITETTANSIPTGGFIPVGGTPFDFRSPTNLGQAMRKGDDLFDNNYCVTTHGNKGLNFVSRVTHPPSGRTLEVYSDQAGVQLYTSNFLPPAEEQALPGKEDVGYRRHAAFCLETQNYPDAVHHVNFPTAVLSPGDVYKHNVEYRFGAENSVEPRVGLNFVSRVTHPPSGRTLEVYSDQAGVQLYTSNFLPPAEEQALPGKEDVGYRRHAAFCLETQNYPDAVHHVNFPTAVLSPGDVYKHNVEYRFGAENSVEPRVVGA